MRFSGSAPFRGDTNKSLGLAESALTALGFRITKRGPESLEMIGPGMNSTRQSALVGASRIEISRRQGELAVDAELDGVQRMSRFVTVFPICLCTSLAIVLCLVFWAQFGMGAWLTAVVAATGGNALVWLVLGPLMARSIRTRTWRALDALLANMVAVGQSGE